MFIYGVFCIIQSVRVKFYLQSRQISIIMLCYYLFF